MKVVALGDSTSCGEGVGLRLAPALTWPARLAMALPDAQLQVLAAPGARVRDVLSDQAPQVAVLQPDLVTLLIGLNDVWRAGFTAGAFEADLQAVLALLRPTGAYVLLGRLPEPGRHLPLPPTLRRTVLARAAAVDAAVGRATGVAVLDVSAVPGLRLRRAWEVDRLHPNAAGHALLAEAAARVLQRDGLPAGRVQTSALPPAPGRAHEALWLLRDGLPWLVRHLPQVLGPAMAGSLR
ncbi:MAG: SGNH/GDSL hydrolase family protein [Frankiales bacterium]|nr:SGNH/GDSL hydrolase family protein [Frankiales bacterium]